MKINIGDVLVFAGSKEGKRLDDHFRNFEIGKRYEISDITSIFYDIDEVTRMGGKCVLFKGETYGCHEENIEKYFVHQDEWREGLLSKLLSRSIVKYFIKR